jgi:hypothetical protein
MSATVTVHRVGLLDLTSMIERTIPVTGNPSNITTALSPRYWAKRQRRASRGSVISIVCMQHQWSQYAIRFCDDQHRIREELTKTRSAPPAGGPWIGPGRLSLLRTPARNVRSLMRADLRVRSGHCMSRGERSFTRPSIWRRKTVRRARTGGGRISRRRGSGPDDQRPRPRGIPQ